MGRLGLDPGTLGVDFIRSQASVEIRVSWSEQVARPPTSAEVLTNLGFRLQEWLHEMGTGAVGVVRFVGHNGESFELLIEE